MGYKKTLTNIKDKITRTLKTSKIKTKKQQFVRLNKETKHGISRLSDQNSVCLYAKTIFE